MGTIPATQIVNVLPSVLPAGGAALQLSGFMLTPARIAPVGTVLQFPTQAAVAAYFGAASPEAVLGTDYFAGYDNSNAKPGNMLATQYNQVAVNAYLRGGSLATMTLAQLQALPSSLLGIVIDGVTQQATINLNAATSFSNAAQLIQNALAITGPPKASITASIAGGVMSVTSIASGTLTTGQSISGAGIPAGVYIANQLSGTVGAIGSYTLSGSIGSIGSEAVSVFGPAVEFGSISSAFIVNSPTTGPSSTVAYGSGALATSLNLTLVTGAVKSLGAVAATPVAFMNVLSSQYQNWVSFFTTFDPDNGSGNAQKLLFAGWVAGKNDRYAYVGWDTDASPAASASAPSSFGATVKANNWSGIIPIWTPTTSLNPAAALAAFECGAIASIDFTQTAGRTDMCFRSQSGLFADVTDPTIAANLIANGYDFYEALGTAAQDFVFFYNGAISGPFLWIDSYVNQIWLNNAFQLALVQLLVNTPAIPYDVTGQSLVEAALNDPIQAGLNFGAYAPGAITAQQIVQVNTQAGTNIANILQAQGWYLQVLPASGAVRAARGSPPCRFWYLDRGSVQQINLGSVAVQ